MSLVQATQAVLFCYGSLANEYKGFPRQNAGRCFVLIHSATLTRVQINVYQHFSVISQKGSQIILMIYLEKEMVG